MSSGKAWTKKSKSLFGSVRFAAAWDGPSKEVLGMAESPSSIWSGSFGFFPLRREDVSDLDRCLLQVDGHQDDE